MRIITLYRNSLEHTHTHTHTHSNTQRGNTHTNNNTQGEIPIHTHSQEHTDDFFVPSSLPCDVFGGLYFLKKMSFVQAERFAAQERKKRMETASQLRDALRGLQR
eukprot:GHVR01137901.1.p1 GENE.GHVR01137901.1~~GHVR01137901.1.p1  ORF type:complete len:105 (+),score=46.25 GHVR01137901.1:74-388(+)